MTNNRLIKNFKLSDLKFIFNLHKIIKIKSICLIAQYHYSFILVDNFKINLLIITISFNKSELGTYMITN